MPGRSDERRATRAGVVLALLAALTGLPTHAAGGDGADPCLVVVVAESAPLQKISLSELRLIFTRQRRSGPAGLKWLPLNRPAGQSEGEKGKSIIMSSDLFLFLAFVMFCWLGST